MNKADSLLSEYVLPDYKTIKKGFVRGQDEQSGKPEELGEDQ